MRIISVSGSSDSSDEAEGWQPCYVVITDRELRLYEVAPWSAATWCAPLESFALAATRLASWRRAGAGDAAWLGVRAGTTAGLAARTLRADTANDLTAVAQALVDGAHQAATEQTEFTFPGLAARTLRADTANDLTAVAQALVDGAHQAATEQIEFTFPGLAARTLRADTANDLTAVAQALVDGAHQAATEQTGFTFRCRYRGSPACLSLGGGGVCIFEGLGSLGRGGARPVLRRPLHALRASADDDRSTLWLHFANNDSAELEMEGSPKPAVFILHNLLSARVHQLPEDVATETL
ncbi:unnamed protein product [Plutella xylostella]|uniref:(diamondback moth) hypothetical protein n=1 Tax=Plutella xylostella TaxID=51655 RepID=A0A8S4EEP3_PLUXY|nr:unnamed protein product [Plutella xylostella]